jgi:hypothetical protein
MLGKRFDADETPPAHQTQNLLLTLRYAHDLAFVRSGELQKL